ncbi:MAG: polymerase sigma-70 factor, subfamily [Acidobacteriota bacterium]|jgi:RNA polymerase sigma-70 factor (ECF subfamily)|nr:polymerase sigma-70 factor, subfamily [Acidobacteriota bacterium]
MSETGTATNLLLIVGTPGASTAAQPALETSPDARLVEAVRRGDRESFGQLYELYGAMVHGILLARVPWDEVDDLVQDVFLVAFKRISTLREAGAFGGWLAMIARNRAVDFHRRKRETEELPENLAQRSSVDPEAAEALSLIRTLPEAYRETLVLRLVEGMTGPEIAERTGLTPASVRVNLHRGMKLLREKLGMEKQP